MERPKSIASREIHAAFSRLAAAILERHAGTLELWLLGIANGGLEVAGRLAAALQGHPPLRIKSGSLDISFHRDDLSRHPIPKEFNPSYLPGDVTGATVILVDDVFFTGRTVKAALDELFEHGRPARVELAVLVDRGERRLPIVPDYIGLSIAAGPDQEVAVMLDSAQPAADAIHVTAAHP